MNKELYISLIARQLSNELNSSQLENLNSWLSKSKDNANLLSEFKTTWAATATYKQDVGFNADAAFSSFSQKFNIPKSNKAIAISQKNANFSRNAIVSMLILTFLFLGYVFNNYISKNVTNNDGVAVTKTIDDKTAVTLSPNSKFDSNDPKVLKANEEEMLSALLARHEKSNNKVNSFLPSMLDFHPGDQLLSIKNFEGQGYFDLNDKPFKFIGLDHGNIIGASNSSFNIQNYDDDNMTIIDVQSGSLILFTGINESFVIDEGERAIFDKAKKSLIKVPTPKLSPFKWHKGILVFDNTPLDKAFILLERFYGVEIIVTDDSRLTDKNFTATFPISSNLNECLELINASFDMTIKRIDNKKVEISNIQGQ